MNPTRSPKTLQIVMPMAGLGSRFAKAGFDLPKPLILVGGMPMFQKALTTVDGIEVPKRFIFVIRQEHVDTQQLDQLVRDHLPEAEVVVIPEMTRGAAETVLMAKPKLNPSDPMIAMDCDLWFQSASYNQMVTESLTGASGIAGGVITFTADNPRYSYAKLDEHDMVIETAEKRVISDRAMTGAYFFAAAQTYLDSVRNLMKQPLSEAMPEYYISYVYNEILANGGKIKAARVDQFASFGTPEELAAYEQSQT